jgi:hypothetical protein
MSLDRIAELAELFQIKLAEQEYSDHKPEDVKVGDLDWIDEQTRAEIRENGKKEEYLPFDKDHNPPGIIADEKTWKRAKKAVKPYWRKYETPWAVVFDIYKNKMHGKIRKRTKKKSEIINDLLQKYGQYIGGPIPNTTPPQNNVGPDLKHLAVQAVYKLVNSLYAEKQQGKFEHNSELQSSYDKILAFYHSLLQKGKRPKFELYDEAVSDPTGFSVLEEENNLSIRGGPKPTKLDRMLATKSEVLRRHLKEANEAVRNFKQDIRD